MDNVNEATLVQAALIFAKAVERFVSMLERVEKELNIGAERYRAKERIRAKGRAGEKE
jgi:hypothetical protein